MKREAKMKNAANGHSLRKPYNEAHPMVVKHTARPQGSGKNSAALCQNKWTVVEPPSTHSLFRVQGCCYRERKLESIVPCYLSFQLLD